MQTITGGLPSVQALQNGALQTAEIHIYDPTTPDDPNSRIGLHNENIVKGSLTISKASSGSGSVELGSTISDQLTVSLRCLDENGEDLLTPMFLYGKCLWMNIGWDYQDENERVRTDTIYVFSGIITEDAVDGVIHRITALDALIVFDRPYRLQGLLDDNNVQLTYPVTAFNLLKAIVKTIGTPYISSNAIAGFNVPVNLTYTINGIEEDDVTTYRQVMRWCAQMLGCSIRTTTDAERKLELYRFEDAIVDDTNLVIDESVSYRFSMTPPKYPNNRFIMVVQRAGKNVVVMFDIDDIGERVTIADNPFFRDSIVDLLTSNILTALLNDAPSNLRVQLQASTVSMLYLEPGDIVRVPRPDGTVYAAIITSVTHKLNGGSVITASAAGDVLPTMISTPSFSQSQEATLNARFAQYDTLLTHDYIVEQGTSTETTTDGATVNWNYRKWNSGVMELWGEADYFQNNTYTGIQVTPVTRDGATIGWTTGTTMSPIPFPAGVEFISGPIVTATWNIGGLDVLVTVAGVNRESGSTWVSFTPRLFSLTTSRIVGYMRIVVLGRWK